ncbi:DMT family transporter [Lactiplantibacillus mudanjiangensis]|uniref:Quaternary ammonium compound-resistance protein [Lactobacillus plantarum JDM1] n=1 Tax=Lactiplantibacillus mudanjiangensis TaxID=1296538 RepID=A0A660E2R0_9LACO|nr:multidrug efflux SMR transporter [Lactiplantibacillus mudanjiangensis]VDG23934.1 quaternary ammonium compound-resistance protein [Lactobacillus plantarum JDM1] [Lactiplantibacillus mudanjiangensis]VDG27110.1 quaternary ammonium compound-resistance protein [Lactobacillus plantarum JDM1] [Lactiplantibacillus mudanjiangensis]VDG33984.1 quaternary ammonium compound-resistance protein [Lactobacillus plantarum JDM1] [Lactiplantibacillus mudanjiangensis]
MAYSLLFGGILMEVIGSFFLKRANGFRNLIPSMMVLVSYFSSLVLVTMAMRHLPLGIAYALWAGLGTVATVILAVVVYRERLSLARVSGLMAIVIGAVLLNI